MAWHLLTTVWCMYGNLTDAWVETNPPLANFGDLSHKTQYYQPDCAISPAFSPLSSVYYMHPCFSFCGPDISPLVTFDTRLVWSVFCLTIVVSYRSCDPASAWFKTKHKPVWITSGMVCLWQLSVAIETYFVQWLCIYFDDACTVVIDVADCVIGCRMIARHLAIKTWWSLRFLSNSW